MYSIVGKISRPLGPRGTRCALEQIVPREKDEHRADDAAGEHAEDQRQDTGAGAAHSAGAIVVSATGATGATAGGIGCFWLLDV